METIPAIVVQVNATSCRREQASRDLTISYSTSAVADPPPTMAQRRVAQYHPTIWGPDLIEAFTTHYAYESHATRLESLKQNVSGALVAASNDACLVLELVDAVQRLGVAYHFEKEIQTALTTLVSSASTLSSTYDLHTAALHFRILRQFGISVSSDVFDKFRSGEGSFKDSISDNVKGLLSLYEASHLGMPGEDVLEEAKRFSVKMLKESLGGILNDNNLLKRVEQALETPVHWSMPRIQALNYINTYQMDDTKNLALLELAILDYNLVQSVYQMEIKELSRWYREMDFQSEASFSRDRLMENYLWAMGISYEPQFSECRICLTKYVCILSVIDDMYDVYGFLDELEQFTDAVQQWSIEAKVDLQEYMKPVYSAMLNFGNKLADDSSNNNSLDTLMYIKNEWVNLCISYMVEARWFYSGYVPTLEQYLKNAWTSVGGPGGILHAYLPTEGCQLTKASLESFDHGSQLIYWASLLTRLSDDLGTSKAERERGDVAKSVQCCMEEKGISEEEAEEYIKGLIIYAWKKINQESAKTSLLPRSLVNLSLNMARSAHCIFQHGDGIGSSTGVTKDRLISLIANPIPIDDH